MPTARRVRISTPIKSTINEQGEMPHLETPKAAVDPEVTPPRDQGAQQEEYTLCIPVVEEAGDTKAREPVIMVPGMVDVINVSSGDSSGFFAMDYLDIADEFSAISMTENL